jgi:fatty-acyl-CoA synthase
MEIYVALARAGLVAVPVNFRLTGPEITYILNNAEVSAVIAGSDFCATLDSQKTELPIPLAGTSFWAMRHMLDGRPTKR